MKLLITRLSALGDVAMAVPVVKALATQYPNLDITFASKGFCAPLFEGLADNVRFIGLDLKDRNRGIAGLRKAVRELNVDQYDAVADFHDVLRTKYLRFYAMLHGVREASIDKNREGRRALVRQREKKLVQQRTSFEKYVAVLEELGFKIDLSQVLQPVIPTTDALSSVTDFIAPAPMVGIAPFAAHAGKIYPMDKMRKVIESLNAEGVEIRLFGGGLAEEEQLDALASDFTHVKSVAGKLGGMKEELALMSKLSCMVSMDSANMHLASLVGTPVVSIWGATHPKAGFMGWRQTIDNAVQLDMSCRPCSIFGNKPCLRGDLACMMGITPEMIIEKVKLCLQH